LQFIRDEEKLLTKSLDTLLKKKEKVQKAIDEIQNRLNQYNSNATNNDVKAGRVNSQSSASAQGMWYSYGGNQPNHMMSSNDLPTPTIEKECDSPLQQPNSFDSNSNANSPGRYPKMKAIKRTLKYSKNMKLMFGGGEKGALNRSGECDILPPLSDEKKERVHTPNDRSDTGGSVD
jgi:hypothetical protein